MGPAAGIIDDILQCRVPSDRIRCAVWIPAGHLLAGVGIRPKAQQVVHIPVIAGGIPQAQGHVGVCQVIVCFGIGCAGGGIGRIKPDSRKGVIFNGNAVQLTVRHGVAIGIQQCSIQGALPERPVMGGQVQPHAVNALPAFERNGQVQPGCAVILRCSVRRGRNYNGTGIIIVDDFIHRLVIHTLTKIKPGPRCHRGGSQRHQQSQPQQAVLLAEIFDFLHEALPALGCLQTVLLYMMICESAIRECSGGFPAFFAKKGLSEKTLI